MKVNLSEAARRAGINRRTLYRQLENGRLSKEIDESGNPVIELSELCRIYPKAILNGAQGPHRAEPRAEPQNAHFDTAAAQQIAHLSELLAQVKHERDTLSADRERLTKELGAEQEERRLEREESRRLQAALEREREKSQRLLTAFTTPPPSPEPPAAQPPPEPPQPAPERKGFRIVWPWSKGK